MSEVKLPKPLAASWLTAEVESASRDWCGFRSPGVIGEAIAVAAEVELIIGLIEVAGGEDEFGIVVAFEAGAWGDVEYAVGAVAIVGGITPALRFHSVDVFWVELRDQGCWRCWCWNRNAVDEPAHLVSARTCNWSCVK